MKLSPGLSFGILNSIMILVLLHAFSRCHHIIILLTSRVTHCTVLYLTFAAAAATVPWPVNQHPLDRIIVQLVQFLDVDKIRLRLRQSGILTGEDLRVLLDISVNPSANQALRVETLVEILKRKGEDGMTAFIEALNLTTDGTGHKTILGSLVPNTELSAL